MVFWWQILPHLNQTPMYLADNYSNIIELIFGFPMVFILCQSDIYWKSYGILKL